MSNQALAIRPVSGEVMERVIALGDLSKLTAPQRCEYYGAVCQSVGLNPLTRPFEYLVLNSKMVLYARKDATDQLRNLHGVSVQIMSRERMEDVYVVTARATMPDGRTDESVGAVSIVNARGDQLANALMKAETKAKRRVTLSICGLGLLDDTEIETIPGAQRVEVDDAGQIIEAEPQPEPPKTVKPSPEAARIARILALRQREAELLGANPDTEPDFTNWSNQDLNEYGAMMARRVAAAEGDAQKQSTSKAK